MATKRVFSGSISSSDKTVPVELVLDVGDPLDEVYYIGRIACCSVPGGKVFSRKGDAKKLWSVHYSMLYSVEAGSEGSLWSKRHFLKIHSEGELHWVFMSGPDAASVVQLLTPVVDACHKMRMVSIAIEHNWPPMLEVFKSGTVVDLHAFAREQALWLDDFTGDIGALTPEVAEMMNDAEKHDMRLCWLKNRLRSDISSGSLHGVLDEAAAEYRDRAYIVQQQRVVNVTVDFNSLLAQLGNRGVVLQGIQCPECGGTTSEVPSGSYFTCQYCRATVKATDVFEKFKAVLG